MEILLGDIRSGNKEYGRVGVFYDESKEQFLLVSTSKYETLVLSKEEMKKLYDNLERIVNYLE